MWKIVIDKTVSHNRNSKKRSLWKWIVNYKNWISIRKLGRLRKNFHVKWNLSQALAASNGIRLYVTLACVNKIGLLRSIYTGHYRWSSNQMDFMSRGHHSSGDFCWMIFIFWFRAPPFSFFLFQSSIILFSLAKGPPIFDHTSRWWAQWYIIHPIVFLLFE